MVVDDLVEARAERSLRALVDGVVVALGRVAALDGDGEDEEEGRQHGAGEMPVWNGVEAPPCLDEGASALVPGQFRGSSEAPIGITGR